MRSYNTRLIFDSPEDREKVLHVLEAQRLAFNECSKIRYGLKNNSVVDLHAKFYHSYRQSNPAVPAQVVIRAECEVLATYASIKTNKHKITQAPQKERLSMRLDKHLYAYKGGQLILTTFEKRLKCKFHVFPKLKSFLDTIPFCDPLLFVKNNEIWISLAFKTPDRVVQQTTPIGIDLGIRYSAVTSEEKFYRFPSFNARKRKLRYLKSRLKSKGTHSARKHLRKLRHREQNMNRAQCHLLANAILRDAKGDVLVLEDLTKIKRKKGFENKNRISQVPFYLLKTILTYKAPDYGKTVISVSPHFTSQIDHRMEYVSGHKFDHRTGRKDGVRRGMRFTCNDGVVLHADLNASINIRNRWNDPTMIKVKKPKTPKVYRGSTGKPLCLPNTPILLEYTKVCPSTTGQATVTSPIVIKSR
jgi:IS605 OrfB family transposase